MKKFFIAVFAAFTSIYAFVYLASCLTPFISPVHFWPMAFLALGFPYLATGIIILFFLWIFINKKIALILFLLFFAGFQNIFATYALNFAAKPRVLKDNNSLRILTWNVRGFDNPSIEFDSIHSVRRQMFHYLSRMNPDVLCLQEFTEYYTPGTFSNTADLIKLGYTYYYRSNETNHYNPGGMVVSGTAIFSKLPLTDTSKVLLGDTSFPEYLLSADVLFKHKKIRIFATHLKSISLFAEPREDRNKVIFYGDSNFVYTSSRFQKLKAFAQAHAREVLIAKEALNKSPFPVILGTDMNSVPASYPYHVLSGDLQDAFKLYGMGLGTTMDNLPKTLRIDFLFVDKRLTIQNFNKDLLHLSDHFPQFVDLKWKQ